MRVHIIIRRKVPETMREQVADLTRLMRRMALRQDGYFYGETLAPAQHSDEHIIISTWRSLGCWHRWSESSIRRKIQTRIDAVLESETEYRMQQDTLPRSFDIAFETLPAAPVGQRPTAPAPMAT